MKAVYVPVLLFVGTTSMVPTHFGERIHRGLGPLYGEVMGRESLWCHPSVPPLPSEDVGNEPWTSFTWSSRQKEARSPEATFVTDYQQDLSGDSRRTLFWE